jgi:cardiolipin synthase
VETGPVDPGEQLDAVGHGEGQGWLDWPGGPGMMGRVTYPRRSGNRVVPWIDGVPFYARLLAAIRGARRRVWAVVSFIEPGFKFADGTAWWDLLDECVARGVEVRVLFWRNPRFFKTGHVFLGSAADRAFLAGRGARWMARWDSSGEDPGHCHHQKGFVIDAGSADGIAFVGGMVLSHATLARPGHPEGTAKHDAFVELQGPVVADAAANFVQRWNLARMDAEAPPWPDAASAGPLVGLGTLPPKCGDVDVQLRRTIRAGDYECAEGEAEILDSYRRAFAGARRTIYIENQHPGEVSLLIALAEALRRGVRVVMVAPAEPMGAIVTASREVAALGERAEEHRYGATFRGLAALDGYEGFTLVALARSDRAGDGWRHREIYTHAKLCVVDGAWATIGSANLVDLSLCADHSELNAEFWGEATCWPLLRGLIEEHTGIAAEDDVAALTAIAEQARASSASLIAGGPVLVGCYALSAARYGQDAALTGCP